MNFLDNAFYYLVIKRYKIYKNDRSYIYQNLRVIFMNEKTNDR